MSYPVTNEEIPSIAKNPIALQGIVIHQDKRDYFKVKSDFSLWTDLGVPILSGLIVGVIVGIIVGWRANVFQKKLEVERQKREDEKEKKLFIEKLQREYAIALHNLNSVALLEKSVELALSDPSKLSSPLLPFKEHDLYTLAAINDYILNKGIKIEDLDQHTIFLCYSSLCQLVLTLKMLSEQIDHAMYRTQNSSLCMHCWGSINSGGIIPGIYTFQGLILEVIIKILEAHGKDFTEYRKSPLYKKCVIYKEQLHAKSKNAG